MNEVDPKSVIKTLTECMYSLLQTASTRPSMSNAQFSEMFDICQQIQDSCSKLEMYEHYIALNLVHIHLRELIRLDPSLTNFIIEINLKEPGRTPGYLKLNLYPNAPQS